MNILYICYSSITLLKFNDIYKDDNTIKFSFYKSYLL